MSSRFRKYSSRARDAFFYDSAARIRIKEKEIAAQKRKILNTELEPKKKPLEDESFKENGLFKKVDRSDIKDGVLERTAMDRQSDKIMQNILNASKLLEGRFTFEQLITLDIPTFENIVSNEFANVDNSYKNFKEHGSINAYTKNEIQNLDEKFLKDLNKNVN